MSVIWGSLSLDYKTAGFWTVFITKWAYCPETRSYWFGFWSIRFQCPYLSFRFLCPCVCCVSIQYVSSSVHAIAYVWRSEVSHECKPPLLPCLRQGLLSHCRSEQLDHRLLRLFLFLLLVPPDWDTRAVGLCHHIWLPIFLLVWHMCPCLTFSQPGSYTPCLSKAIISFACQHGNTNEVGSQIDFEKGNLIQADHFFCH